MDSLFAAAVLFSAFSTAFLITCFSVLRCRGERRKWEATKKASVLVVAGSGGHTKEILLLTEQLGKQFTPRQYVVASTDTISIKKINESEKLHHNSDSSSESKYEVFTVPRSREVKQSWFTTVFTTLYATLHSLLLVFRLKPQVILCNGPGTCVPICYAGLLLKMFGITDTQLVYVESICRVETLSLSAKLLYPIADSLLVQWPSLTTKYPKCKYIGRVV